jgi:hypothetical protein
MIRDLFPFLYRTFLSLKAGDQVLWLVVSGAVAVAFYVGALNYTRLWNLKAPRRWTYHLLCGVAALLSFTCSISFVCLGHLGEVAHRMVDGWAEALIQDNAWAAATFDKAYNQVKAAGKETFGPTLGRSIPAKEPETRALVARIYTEAGCENFATYSPFLNRVISPSIDGNAKLLTDDMNGTLAGTDLQVVALPKDDQIELRKHRDGLADGRIEASLIWDGRNELSLQCDVPMEGAAARGKPGVAERPIRYLYLPPTLNLMKTYAFTVKYVQHRGSDLHTQYTLRIKHGDIYRDFKGELFFEGEELQPAVLQVVLGNASFGATYGCQHGVKLLSNLYQGELHDKVPRIVRLARICLIAAFLLIQSIPFGIIGYSAYKNIKVTV